ncbi:hypothetical protein PABY_22430 [Pyrodictium abyssi]|uniref:Uncharacterized protein n=1 Tax=Pyrodictium abyssi TaxID=54256 RepID=A0ABM8IYQ4_9CREN|nr:hypothetical protein PABY_22430 [Pyrodictium abyssi]
MNPLLAVLVLALVSLQLPAATDAQDTPGPGDYAVYSVEASTGVKLQVRVDILDADDEGFLVETRVVNASGVGDPVARLLAGGLEGRHRIPRGNRVNMTALVMLGAGPGILYVDPGSLPNGGVVEKSLRFMGAKLRIRAAWDTGSGWLKAPSGRYPGCIEAALQARGKARRLQLHGRHEANKHRVLIPPQPIPNTYSGGKPLPCLPVSPAPSPPWPLASPGASPA